MSVLIGMASIDERGKAYGGQAGDQTGREVYTLPWYNGGWNVVLRAKEATVAEKMAAFCEAACDNPQIGYDQWQRNSLRAAAADAGWDGAAIFTPCECDCSSLMCVCAEAAGVDVSGMYSYGNAATTYTMRNAFFRTGRFEVLLDRKYLDSADYLKRGDILLRESGHTAMCLGNGAKAISTSNSAAASVPAADTSINSKTYTVVSGDTLWAISIKFGVTIAAICEANGLDPARYIYPGQRLVIP